MDLEHYYVYNNILYLINTKKEIINTNCKISDDKYNNSLIDCEYIKEKNILAAFDVLIYCGNDITKKELKYRYNRLMLYNEMEIINEDNNSIINFMIKKIYIPEVNFGKDMEYKSFYEICNFIYLTNKDNYPYDLDGLIIYTTDGDYRSPTYKWKPSEFNSIYFLIKLRDNNTYENSEEKEENIVVYLCSGITENEFKINKLEKPSYYNSIFKNIRNRWNFPMFFMPKNDPETFILNLDVINKNGTYYSKKNNISIKDNTIVEMSYDITNKTWIPLRLREDKKWPNGWKTAINVWNTIQKPLTINMIIGKEDIPIDYFRDNIGESLIDGQRKFHNFVKEYLYTGWGKNSKYLLELAGGRAGDLHKWINLNIGIGGLITLVDNDKSALIEGQRRLETLKLKGQKKKPDVEYILKDLTKDFYKTKKKVDLVSIQFGIMYFLKNEETFDNFFKNIDKNLKEGGYFIGTTLDGKKVSKFLKEQKIKNKESYSWFKENNDNLQTKIYEIERNYVNDILENYGQKINVYVETIGKHPEFLVNFDNMEKYMRNKGYKLIESEMFDSLLTKWNENLISKHRNIINLSNEEKEFGTMYRYFVFKRKR